MIWFRIFRPDYLKQRELRSSLSWGCFSKSLRASVGWRELCRPSSGRSGLYHNLLPRSAAGAVSDKTLTATSSQSFLEIDCSPQNILGGTSCECSTNGQRPWAPKRSREWIILMSAEFSLHPGGKIELMKSLQSFRAWFSAIVNQHSSV